jgi:DNA-binding transcriptional MerR regulator
MAETNLLDDYYTKEQLADQLKRSTRTLDRWDALRVGPPVTKLAGGRRLYARASVVDWLRQQEQQPPRLRRRR